MSKDPDRLTLSAIKYSSLLLRSMDILSSQSSEIYFNWDSSATIRSMLLSIYKLGISIDLKARIPTDVKCDGLSITFSSFHLEMFDWKLVRFFEILSRSPSISDPSGCYVVNLCCYDSPICKNDLSALRHISLQNDSIKERLNLGHSASFLYTAGDSRHRSFLDAACSKHSTKVEGNNISTDSNEFNQLVLQLYASRCPLSYIKTPLNPKIFGSDWVDFFPEESKHADAIYYPLPLQYNKGVRSSDDRDKFKELERAKRLERSLRTKTEVISSSVCYHLFKKFRHAQVCLFKAIKQFLAAVEARRAVLRQMRAKLESEEGSANCIPSSWRIEVPNLPIDPIESGLNILSMTSDEYNCTELGLKGDVPLQYCVSFSSLQPLKDALLLFHHAYNAMELEFYSTMNRFTHNYLLAPLEKLAALVDEAEMETFARIYQIRAVLSDARKRGLAIPFSVLPPSQINCPSVYVSQCIKALASNFSTKVIPQDQATIDTSKIPSPEIRDFLMDVLDVATVELPERINRHPTSSNHREIQMKIQDLFAVAANPRGTFAGLSLKHLAAALLLDFEDLSKSKNASGNSVPLNSNASVEASSALMRQAKNDVDNFKRIQSEIFLLVAQDKKKRDILFHNESNSDKISKKKAKQPQNNAKRKINKADEELIHPLDVCSENSQGYTKYISKRRGVRLFSKPNTMLERIEDELTRMRNLRNENQAKQREHEASLAFARWEEEEGDRLISNLVHEATRRRPAREAELIASLETLRRECSSVNPQTLISHCRASKLRLLAYLTDIESPVYSLELLNLLKFNTNNRLWCIQRLTRKALRRFEEFLQAIQIVKKAFSNYGHNQLELPRNKIIVSRLHLTSSAWIEARLVLQNEKLVSTMDETIRRAGLDSLLRVLKATPQGSADCAILIARWMAIFELIDKKFTSNTPSIFKNVNDISPTEKEIRETDEPCTSFESLSSSIEQQSTLRFLPNFPAARFLDTFLKSSDYLRENLQFGLNPKPASKANGSNVSNGSTESSKNNLTISMRRHIQASFLSGPVLCPHRCSNFLSCLSSVRCLLHVHTALYSPIGTLFPQSKFEDDNNTLLPLIDLTPPTIPDLLTIVRDIFSLSPRKLAPLQSGQAPPTSSPILSLQEFSFAINAYCNFHLRPGLASSQVTPKTSSDTQQGSQPHSSTSSGNPTSLKPSTTKSIFPLKPHFSPDVLETFFMTSKPIGKNVISADEVFDTLRKFTKIICDGEGILYPDSLNVSDSSFLNLESNISNVTPHMLGNEAKRNISNNSNKNEINNEILKLSSRENASRQQSFTPMGVLYSTTKKMPSPTIASDILNHQKFFSELSTLPECMRQSCCFKCYDILNGNIPPSPDCLTKSFSTISGFPVNEISGVEIPKEMLIIKEEAEIALRIAAIAGEFILKPYPEIFWLTRTVLMRTQKTPLSHHQNLKKDKNLGLKATENSPSKTKESMLFSQLNGGVNSATKNNVMSPSIDRRTAENVNHKRCNMHNDGEIELSTATPKEAIGNKSSVIMNKHGLKSISPIYNSEALESSFLASQKNAKKIFSINSSSPSNRLGIFSEYTRDLNNHGCENCFVTEVNECVNDSLIKTVPLEDHSFVNDLSSLPPLPMLTSKNWKLDPEALRKADGIKSLLKGTNLNISSLTLTVKNSASKFKNLLSNKNEKDFLRKSIRWKLASNDSLDISKLDSNANSDLKAWEIIGVNWWSWCSLFSSQQLDSRDSKSISILGAKLSSPYRHPSADLVSSQKNIPKISHDSNRKNIKPFLLKIYQTVFSKMSTAGGGPGHALKSLLQSYQDADNPVIPEANRQEISPDYVSISALKTTNLIEDGGDDTNDHSSDLLSFDKTVDQIVRELEKNVFGCYEEEDQEINSHICSESDSERIELAVEHDDKSVSATTPNSKKKTWQSIKGVSAAISFSSRKSVKNRNDLDQLSIAPISQFGYLIALSLEKNRHFCQWWYYSEAKNNPLYRNTIENAKIRFLKNSNNNSLSNNPIMNDYIINNKVYGLGFAPEFTRSSFSSCTPTERSFEALLHFDCDGDAVFASGDAGGIWDPCDHIAEPHELHVSVNQVENSITANVAIFDMKAAEPLVFTKQTNLVVSDSSSNNIKTLFSGVNSDSILVPVVNLNAVDEANPIDDFLTLATSMITAVPIFDATKILATTRSQILHRIHLSWYPMLDDILKASSAQRSRHFVFQKALRQSFGAAQLPPALNPHFGISGIDGVPYSSIANFLDFSSRSSAPPTTSALSSGLDHQSNDHQHNQKNKHVFTSFIIPIPALEHFAPAGFNIKSHMSNDPFPFERLRTDVNGWRSVIPPATADSVLLPSAKPLHPSPGELPPGMTLTSVHPSASINTALKVSEMFKLSVFSFSASHSAISHSVALLSGSAPATALIECVFNGDVQIPGDPDDDIKRAQTRKVREAFVPPKYRKSADYIHGLAILQSLSPNEMAILHGEGYAALLELIDHCDVEIVSNRAVNLPKDLSSTSVSSPSSPSFKGLQDVSGELDKNSLALSKNTSFAVKSVRSDSLAPSPYDIFASRIALHYQKQLEQAKKARQSGLGLPYLPPVANEFTVLSSSASQTAGNKEKELILSKHSTLRTSAANSEGFLQIDTNLGSAKTSRFTKELNVRLSRLSLNGSYLDNPAKLCQHLLKALTIVSYVMSKEKAAYDLNLKMKTRKISEQLSKYQSSSVGNSTFPNRTLDKISLQEDELSDLDQAQIVGNKVLELVESIVSSGSDDTHMLILLREMEIILKSNLKVEDFLEVITDSTVERGSPTMAKYLSADLLKEMDSHLVKCLNSLNSKDDQNKSNEIENIRQHVFSEISRLLDCARRAKISKLQKPMPRLYCIEENDDDKMVIDHSQSKEFHSPLSPKKEILPLTNNRSSMHIKHEGSIQTRMKNFNNEIIKSSNAIRSNVLSTLSSDMQKSATLNSEQSTKTKSYFGKNGVLHNSHSLPLLSSPSKIAALSSTVSSIKSQPKKYFSNSNKDPNRSIAISVISPTSLTVATPMIQTVNSLSFQAFSPKVDSPSISITREDLVSSNSLLFKVKDEIMKNRLVFSEAEPKISSTNFKKNDKKTSAFFDASFYNEKNTPLDTNMSVTHFNKDLKDILQNSGLSQNADEQGNFVEFLQSAIVKSEPKTMRVEFKKSF